MIYKNSRIAVAFLIFLFCLFSGNVLLTTAHAGWVVKQVRNQKTVTPIQVHSTRTNPRQGKTTLTQLPEFFAEGLPPSSTQYEEVLYSDIAMPQTLLKKSLMVSSQVSPSWADSEVRALVQQGNDGNRIVLTIVGDGYTLEEKEKFFDDANRITEDLFGESTFASYLPLFNVNAVFVPSQESGISDIEEKNTALGLYRSPKGSKRAIMPGDTSAIERALRLTGSKTDFPILLANDDYYGGLGGRYAITTRSHNSGSMVLRHELGHNFGNVGEEYDGGYVYQGANHSEGTTKWAHWANGPIKASEYLVLSGDYEWKNLKNNPITVNFNFPSPSHEGAYILNVILSSVGWATPDDVHVFIDGLRTAYHGVFTSDRSFFEIEPQYNVKPGSHSLFLREAKQDQDNVMAFARVYAMHPNYDMTPGAIGAFSTFNSNQRRVGYRPTHDTCLMRNMRSKEFCAPDKENMWVRFLNRVSLIDGVKTSATGGRVKLFTPDLDGLVIHWYQIDRSGNLTEIDRIRNRKIADSMHKGTYRVRVKFSSPEVRVVNKPQFVAQKDFTI